MFKVDEAFCKEVLKLLGIVVKSQARMNAAQVAILNLAYENQEQMDMLREKLVDKKTLSEIGAKYGKNSKYVELVVLYKEKQLKSSNCSKMIKNGIEEGDLVNTYYVAEACQTAGFRIHTMLGDNDVIDHNSIDKLDLPWNIEIPLKKSGFTTIAELKEHIRTIGPCWYEGIKRIGYDEASVVEDALSIVWPKRIGLHQGDTREKHARYI